MRGFRSREIPEGVRFAAAGFQLTSTSTAANFGLASLVRYAGTQPNEEGT